MHYVTTCTDLTKNIILSALSFEEHREQSTCNAMDYSHAGASVSKGTFNNTVTVVVDAGVLFCMLDILLICLSFHRPWPRICIGFC